MIKELPDIKLTVEDYYEYREIELLDYIWEVADHFLPNIEGVMSKAPAIFCERYHQRNLPIEERCERNKRFYLSNTSFDDYLKIDNKPLKANFEERYLNNECLQNTISAFGLDVSKLWYLLLFVHDYIEDLGNNSPAIGKSTLQDFNDFAEKISEATSIILKKNNRKSYNVEKENTIKIIQVAIQHYIKSYNEIINSGEVERLNEINSSIVGDACFLNFKDRSYLDISYKKWKFAEIFLYFLKDRKAIVPKNSIYNVSKDKMLFISRLIYTVGYDGKRYNEPYDNEGNPNRMLSNLLRRYKKEDFPTVTGGYYML
ncbi:MAG: hypothetical protein IJ436_04320 [Bacteroidaceae bacterium]|nr:hypothetical protein [Bacteroidaceae bacterium]